MICIGEALFIMAVNILKNVNILNKKSIVKFLE
jgi:hypothetical protein